MRAAHKGYPGFRVFGWGICHLPFCVGIKVCVVVFKGPSLMAFNWHTCWVARRHLLIAVTLVLYQQGTRSEKIVVAL